MPNIAVVLKDKISRLVRKELRGETEKLKVLVAQQRTAIAQLKRRVTALEAAIGGVLNGKQVPQASKEGQGPKLRFRHEGFAAHRKRLGSSAEAFGKLVGVSGLTVYKWESGRVHPRATQLPAIAAVRKMGKRDAMARLAT